MKTHVTFVFVACFSFTAQGQPSFAKLYDAGTSFLFNLTELPSRNVLLGLGWARGVSRLDPMGNVLQTHSYWSDTLTGMGGVRRYSDNEYIFAAGYRKGYCDLGPPAILDSYPVIGKMDSLGNVLSIRHYMLGQGCSNVGGDVVVTNDGGVISWGYRSDFFALRVDPDLNPVWAKTFSHNGGFQFIKELPGGDLLAGINMDTAGAVVARMDPSGHFLWCKSYIRPKGMLHDAIIESDDSFIITGYTDSISISAFSPLPATFDPKLFMMKVDGAGEVLWCKGYESDPYPWYTRQWSRIERTLDGKYVLLATLGQQQSNFFYRPFWMKTDLNGDSLWTRSMGSSNDYALYARDLLAHSDGGYIIAAEIQGHLPDLQSSLRYIFRADSLGHLSCHERSYPVEITDLFPVDSSFTLTSVDGAVAGPVFYTDTVLDPFPMYEACTVITAVASVGSTNRRMSIRPNPTLGHFTVEFQDPLMKDSYYSVYDTMGKLLFQRAAAHGKKTEEVDLTGYTKGTYVIRFTDKDGTCYERVVLE